MTNFKNVHLSYSRLSRFEQCPLSFKLHYIDKQLAEPGLPLRFGKAIHAVLEVLVREHVENERSGPLSEDRADELWQEAWAKESLSGVDVFQEGLEILQRFVRDQGALDHHDVLALEKEFHLQVGPFTVLGFIQYVSMVDLKTLLMPALMQGCKGRDTVGDRSKKTLVAFVLAIVVVVLVSGTVTMRECYVKGANNVHPWFYIDGPRGMGLGMITQWIGEAKGPDHAGIAYMVGGAVVSGFLIFMRRSFPWWPLHPLGYIVSDGMFESNRVAFSFFLGWMIKVAILRFGGGGLFKRLRPFFLGLILGEFGTAGFWIVIGFIVGNHGPMVFP